MCGLLLKLTRIQPGFRRSRVMENILYIDAQIYRSMLYAAALYIDAQIYRSMLCAAIDCVSTVNDVYVYLKDHVFVCLGAFIQTISHSTGLSPVARRENALYIDAQIYRSMLYAVFDCVSTVNDDVYVCLINHAFV